MRLLRSFSLLMIIPLIRYQLILLLQSQCATSEEDRLFVKDIPYTQAVGSLLWLALGARPNISYAVGQVAKFNANPGPVH